MALLVGLALMLAACGNSSQAAQTRPTPSPVSTPSPLALPSQVGVTSGMGDTKDNPDTHPACAFEGLSDDGSTVIVYVSVAIAAEADSQAAQAGCDAVKGNASFRATTNAPLGSGTAACYVTLAGAVTIRVYKTAAATDAEIQQLCSSFLSQAK